MVGGLVEVLDQVLKMVFVVKMMNGHEGMHYSCL